MASNISSTSGSGSSDRIRIKPGSGSLDVASAPGTTTITTMSDLVQNLQVESLGEGADVYAGKSYEGALRFRSIKAGTGASVTEANGEIVIGIDAQTAGINSVSNAPGTGLSLVASNVNGAVVLKKVIAGSNVSITETANALTISATSSGSTATNLDSLTDVVVTSPANGQILSFNGTSWVNVAAPAPSSNLDSLTDVVVGTPSVGQVLAYNGTAWVNTTPSTSTSPAPTGGVQQFSFEINFVGTDPATFSNVPTGWSVTSPSVGIVRVTHSLSKVPVNIFIWGLTTTANTWTQRAVGGNSLNMSYLDTNLNRFDINGVSTTTTASGGLKARVHVFFA